MNKKLTETKSEIKSVSFNLVRLMKNADEHIELIEGKPNDIEVNSNSPLYCKINLQH